MASPISIAALTRTASPISLVKATPTLKQESTSTITPTPTSTPCATEICIYTDTFLLTKPISPLGNDRIDTSYRFGTTQGGKRDPHHGVEFLNSFGTPVLAAGDGIVIVAGDDKQVLYSPYPNFYGNLIVIEHQLPLDVRSSIPDMPDKIFSLYAHLSEILVEEGQLVHQGQEIGKVGMSGSATGSHLHFEVRLGENTYANSRNPELWLKPGVDNDNQTEGALAGKLIEADGFIPSIENIVIQYFPEGPDGTSSRESYVRTYEEKGLIGQIPWKENFALGDLPAGWYQISFPYYGLHRQFVQIFPGQLTVVLIELDNQE